MIDWTCHSVIDIHGDFTLCGLFKGSNSGVFYCMGDLDIHLCTCVSCLSVFASRLSPFAGLSGNGDSLEEVLQKRLSFSSVRVIVSPVLTAKFGSNRQIQSDWKSK